MLSNRLQKGQRLFVKILGFVFFFPILLFGSSVIVSWQPNTESDLAGYEVYYGTSSRFYSTILDVGNVSQYTVTGLTTGNTYYFTVTAYDTNGNESTYSEEVSYRVEDTTPPTIVSVVCEMGDGVKVVFSEPVEKTSAELVSNYAINKGIVVQRAELQADLKTVYLYTIQQPNAYYILTVNNVRDRATVPNAIAPNTQIEYSWEGGDQISPTVVSVTLNPSNYLSIKFSEPLNQSSALALTNYSISPSVKILNSFIDNSFSTVCLITDPHTPGQTYTLTINNVKDAAAALNPIAANTQKTYTCTSGDMNPPVLVAARILNATQLQVEFNEKLETNSAQTAANYTISPTVRILSATLNTAQTIVTLNTDPHQAGTYTITVRNVGDANIPSNSMQSGQLAYIYTPPDVTPPTLAQALLTRDDLLEITFSEPVDQTSAETVNNYSIDPAVTINSARLYVDQKTVAIQTTPHSAGTYTVRVNGVKDLAAVPNTINTNSSKTYLWAPRDATPPDIKAVSLYGSTLVELVFDEPLDRTSAEMMSHYTIDKGVTISSISLVGDNLDRVQLKTSMHQPGQTYTITASGIRDRATVPNTTGTLTRTYNYPYTDTTSPGLVSATLQSGNQFLLLNFNEPVEQTSAETPGNFNISNGIQIETATLDASLKTVFLKTSVHTAGMRYTVTVRNVKDLVGNVISTENQNTYTCVSQDMLPPNLVYAELRNDNYLELMFNEPLDVPSAETESNYSVTNGTTAVTVYKAEIMGANQTYVYLTTSKHQRGSYTVSVTGVKDMATPPNTSSQLQKMYNWQPPDTTAPKLLQANAQNKYRIDLQFDEPLDRTTAEDATHYSINNGVVVEKAELDVTMTKVILTTTEQYPGSYTVTLQGIKDASGSANVIQSNTNAQFTFSIIDRTPPAIIDAALHGETMLVINFSEALNRGTAQNPVNYLINNNVQVKSAYLSSYDNQVILETTQHASGEYTLTVNGIQDASQQKNPIVAYSQVKYSWSPKDTIGPSLVDAKLQDSNNLLKLVFDEPVDVVESKKSANYVIAPPVTVYSAVLDGADITTVWLYTNVHQKGTYTVTVSNVKDRSNNPKPNPIGALNKMQYVCLPPDTIAPQLVSVSLDKSSPMLLVVTFDEPVDRQSAENITNYAIEPSTKINQASLLASLNTVHLETDPHQAGINYVLRANGIKDRAPVPNVMKKIASATYTYVQPDTTPPVLLEAKLQGPNLLELVFSKSVEQSSAENRDNYRIDPSVEVLNAMLDPTTIKKVQLETTMHMPGMSYGVNVRNVRDRAPIPNTIRSSNWYNYSLPFTGPNSPGPDKNPPALARVDMISPTRIDLVFTEPLDRLSAENAANYAIHDSITVQSAKVDSDLVKVHLTTTDHRVGKSYSIFVKNISDRATKPNILSVSPTVKYILAKGVSISNPSQGTYELALYDLSKHGYCDRDYTITQAPEYLKGSAQILTSNNDKTAEAVNFLSFEIRGGATVYVAFDNRIANTPNWFADWKATGDQIVDSRSVVYQMYSKRTGGGRFTLGGNMGGMDDNMYLVFVVPNMTNGMLLAKLNRSSYEVSQVVIGDPYYIDRDYTVSAMPDSADEYLWIRTANDDKMNREAKFLSFELMLKSDVYVAYDSKIASLPKWLIGWEATGEQVVDSRGSHFDLHRKTFEASNVELGGNCGSSDDNMYFVMLKPLETQGRDPGYSELAGYFTLTQNYPNPFNPKTTIHYIVHKDGRLKITVFNLLGQTVKVLVDGDFKAGHSDNVVWDGSDHNGNPVSSGMYFYRIEQDHFAKTRRMLLLR